MKKRLVWIVLWMFILGIPTVTFAADTLTTKSGAIWRIGDITKREVILTWISDGGVGSPQQQTLYMDSMVITDEEPYTSSSPTISGVTGLGVSVQ
jgi:hypothetical protein